MWRPLRPSGSKSGSAGRLLQLGALCRAAQEWRVPVAVGPPACRCSSRCPWEGRTLVPTLPFLPSQATFVPFPSFRGTTRIGYRTETGQSTSMTPSTTPAAPQQPSGPDSLSPDAKVLERGWPRPGNLISREARARFSEPSVGLVSLFVFLNCCQSVLCLKDTCKRKVNEVSPPQTAFLGVAFKAPLERMKSLPLQPAPPASPLCHSTTLLGLHQEVSFQSSSFGSVELATHASRFFVNVFSSGKTS